MKAPFALADREAGPEPYCPDFPTLDAYTEAWHFWRAVCRDAQPAAGEGEARLSALEWALERYRAAGGRRP